jgi:hypothetical protein
MDGDPYAKENKLLAPNLHFLQQIGYKTLAKYISHTPTGDRPFVMANLPIVQAKHLLHHIEIVV